MTALPAAIWVNAAAVLKPAENRSAVPCMVARCCSVRTDGSCGDFAHGVCALKRQAIAEFNALSIPDMDEVTDLYALVGSLINVQYTAPGGEQFRLWDDSRIYLGNQLPKKNSDRCYGLTADERYLLVCEYGEGGSDVEIVVFARRKSADKN